MSQKNLEQKSAVAKAMADKLSEGLLFLDGAMGTQLMAKGIEPGKCNEYLNVESPKIILDIHRSYFQAGSDAVLTNTFGANEITLARHNLADKVEQINRAAVKIARQAGSTSSPQAAGKDRYVIGDIGPCGDFLKPLGTLEPERLKDAFARQAKALCDGGVDGFIIETMTAVDEAKVAVEAVESVCSLPVFVSFAFDAAGSDFRTMMGASVETIVSEFSVLGVTAIGFNCGTLKMEQYLLLAEKFAKLLADKNILLLAEPNAGKPELIDDRAVYKIGDEEFAEWLARIHKAGAAIIGGCCGTGPGHIKAMCEKIKK
jgi:5-methyltetrahydrofolate--homocysteine methyltransferase